MACNSGTRHLSRIAICQFVANMHCIYSHSTVNRTTCAKQQTSAPSELICIRPPASHQFTWSSKHYYTITITSTSGSVHDWICYLLTMPLNLHRSLDYAEPCARVLNERSICRTVQPANYIPILRRINPILSEDSLPRCACNSMIYVIYVRIVTNG